MIISRKIKNDKGVPYHVEYMCSVCEGNIGGVLAKDIIWNFCPFCSTPLYPELSDIYAKCKYLNEICDDSSQGVIG